MAIRTRLLILLLGTALAPLAVTSLAHQVSLHIARNRLAANMRQVLDENAEQALQEQLRGYVEVLSRENELVQSLLRRQVREIELALSGTTSTETLERTESTFGFDPNLSVPTAQFHPFFQDTNDPNVAALRIDYQKQGYLVAPWIDPNEVTPTLKALEPLTQVYHETYMHAPKGTMWLSTMFNKGLQTHYPAGGRTPSLGRPDMRRPNMQPPNTPRPDMQRPNMQRPDPRNTDSQRPDIQRPERREPGAQGQDMSGPNTRRPDIQRLDRRGPNSRRPDMRGPDGPRRPGDPRQMRRDPLIIDPSTEQVTVMISLPIRYPDGSAAGSTALVRTIPEIFSSLALPERWGTDVERMFVQVDPNATPEPTARILLHDKVQQPTGRWRRRVVPGRLSSQDTSSFHDMVADIMAGTSGVRKMEFKGQSYLWAYRPIEVQNSATLLIVPYGKVTELARTMEQSLFEESLAWLQITTVFFVLAAIVAVILAVRRARSITHPIIALIDAGRKLAQGDYDSKVHITTGDELEQLGMVFNQAGPKLHEHERIKRSLELAGAVQQNLLPRQAPLLKNFDIAGQCLFCDETGGDCYDFIDLSKTAPDKHGIVLGDVSGHGISAALLMAAIRGNLQADVRHHGHDLIQTLSGINRWIMKDTAVDRFVTLFYGILDDQSRSLTWASAGHEPAVMFRSNNKQIEELPNTGMPIGIMEDATFEQAGPIVFATGDILVVGTDGIWEARDIQDQFFGKERFYQILRDNAHLPTEQICSAVVGAVIEFQDSAPRTDDITLVVVKAK